MMEDRFLKRLRKKARKGLRGWPIATIAFYGPNLSQARSLRKVVSWLSSPTRPTGLGVLELSEAGSAWPSTAAPDRGLGRPVAGRGRARIRGLQDSTVVDLDQAVRIEDGNYETVTTRMQPSVIVSRAAA